MKEERSFILRAVDRDENEKPSTENARWETVVVSIAMIQRGEFPSEKVAMETFLPEKLHFVLPSMANRDGRWAYFNARSVKDKSLIGEKRCCSSLIAIALLSFSAAN